MLRILHINTSDISGGAARAVYRLNNGLRNIGVDSKILVQSKNNDDPNVIGPRSTSDKFFCKLRPHLDRLPLSFYQNKKILPYDLQWLPSAQGKQIKKCAANIYHLHWVNAGFIAIEELVKFQKPIVWTLHDMWGFTGGCHYSDGCEAYTKNCGNCPQLNSNQSFDLSRWVWKRKNKAWRNLNLTVVTPSRWLAECAQKSSLFHNKRIEVIPNGLDLERFKPLPKDLSRKILSWSQNKKFILFGALSADSDPRKGFQYILPALQNIGRQKYTQDAELVIFGAFKPIETPDFGVPVRYIGRLHDDISLALLYAAADVMLVPSTQEAFGQTASEAMACGCPVVAFRTSGLIDIVDHKQNGYLAKPFDTKDLAYGINWILEDSQRQERLSQEARTKTVHKFELQMVAKKYSDLYKNILITKI